MPASICGDLTTNPVLDQNPKLRDTERVMPLSALIFDVDGTLSETEDVHREAFNQAFEELGLDWNWDRELYHQLLRVSGGKERIGHYLATDAPAGAPVNARDEWIGSLHRRKTEIYTGRVDTGTVRLRPGVAALVAAARAEGCRLAIATTTSLPNVESLLRATLGDNGLAVFEVIAASDMVSRKKPASDVYEKALADLGLAPCECLALEDSAIGLKSAAGARIPVVITQSAYTAEDDFTGALAVFQDLSHAAGPAKGSPMRAPPFLQP